VHRRDSDIRYQVRDGAPVFPIHHELASLGRLAGDAVDAVTETRLDPPHARKPVVLVGGSFIGELSVDISEIRDLDKEIYYDVVSLWAPGDLHEADKRSLVEESFAGTGSTPFTEDHSTLTIVDPMRVDMCNISFYQVHEEVPHPPATDTIGSDYVLMHVVECATLPGVLHNRDIVNQYTPERRTDPGFMAYQTRFAKFFLSMLYLHHVYREMAVAGASLLDDRYRIRVPRIIDFVSDSTRLDQAENVERLVALDRAYRKLGGRYAAFAESLVPRRERLLGEARRDMDDYALLIESWAPLIEAGRDTSLRPVRR
jgi:hypothetical protein